MQLAIAKTGAAWLPSDADNPVDRLQVCLDDAQAAGIATDAASAPRLSGIGRPVRTAEGLLAPAPAPSLRREGARPEHPAYVIYTSGSTGKPKGIVVGQGSICHFLRSENEVRGCARATGSTRASRSPSTCRSRKSGSATSWGRRCGSPRRRWPPTRSRCRWH